MDQKGYKSLEGIYTSNPSFIIKEQVVDSFKLSYIRKLLLLSKSKDVPIVLVASPKFGVTSSDCLLPVMDICKEYNVPFLNYYVDEYFSNHKELFREPMHLNFNGARLFSSILVQELACYINYD